MPQRRFWIAMASAKVSRSQPLAKVMGSRNSPKTDRMPKPTIAIRQPIRMTMTGVCQKGAAGVGVEEVITASGERDRKNAT